MRPLIPHGLAATQEALLQVSREELVTFARAGFHGWPPRDSITGQAWQPAPAD